MMRDKRKDKAYFDSYIDYQKKRISQKEEKLAETPNDLAKRKRINISLIKYKMDLMIADYSAGMSLDQLKQDLESVKRTLLELDNIEYETVLNALSFAVLLNEKECGKEIAEKQKDLVDKDKLLTLFATSLSGKDLVWEGSFYLPDVYNQLDGIDLSDDKSAVIEEYLKSWYFNRKDCAWYDSDKKETETYFGYWSFEAAALVKVYGIEDKMVRQSAFYPSF